MEGVSGWDFEPLRCTPAATVQSAVATAFEVISEGFTEQ
jgi:hypothetical protein